MKTHRSFAICSKAALVYIQDASVRHIAACNDPRDFVSMANGDGQSGGIQTVEVAMFDDWIELEPKLWENHLGKQAKRKSRPPAYEGPVEGSETPGAHRSLVHQHRPQGAGHPYRQRSSPSASDRRRASVHAATEKIPKDLNRQWYVDYAKKMLAEMGVPV